MYPRIVFSDLVFKFKGLNPAQNDPDFAEQGTLLKQYKLFPNA